MKICVLGNSHIACLKSAWDIAGSVHPTHHELTFFATMGVSLRNLAVNGERLVPVTKTLRRTLMYTAGQGEVDVPTYDGFLICGLEIALQPIDARVSNQVLRTSCSDIVKTSLAYTLASKIRQITDAPIYTMHPPLFDERTAGTVPFAFIDYSNYFPIVEEALDIPNAHLLKQPAQTIARGHFTKLEFSKNAIRLAFREAGEGMVHEDDDYAHMNSAYGAVRLRDFFDKLAPA